VDLTHSACPTPPEQSRPDRPYGSSITNPQKFLPLANVPLEAQALGNAKGRDYTALDLLAALSGVIAI
jgi:hypothetical protein